MLAHKQAHSTMEAHKVFLSLSGREFRGAFLDMAVLELKDECKLTTRVKD